MSGNRNAGKINENSACGKVWLAGAGPGDAGLLTVKAAHLIEKADVIVYDALISAEVLSRISQNTETIYVGKHSGNHPVPQHEINQILVREAKKGKKVLRLKGGDPFVFGRGGEELETLISEQIPFEVVPGITSSVAVPAYAGIPVTHRDYTSS
ncbi:MAG TPA: uroporphyrinogen-III C-methyltransferase, partial [Candidatus Mediterraneibacter norwichensis]|nr:uroporphyrinogen-III C-methyltransferase [Candidatus Mediterraneibacter norwichensis]